MTTSLQVAVAAFFLAAIPVHAQQAEPLKHLAPYLGDDSLVIGWIDVENADVGSFVEMLRKIGVPKAEADVHQAQLQKIKDRFLEGGVTHVYFTNVAAKPGSTAFSLFDVLMIAPATNPQTVRTVLDEDKAAQTHLAGNVVLFGSANAIGQAAKRQGKVNPIWAKALAQTSALPSHVVILPPRVLLRAFSELQPELPAELGGGPTANLIDALQWASIGADLAAKLKVEFLAQMKDEEAAKRIDSMFERYLAIQKKTREAPDVPLFAKLLEDLRPKQAGDKWRLTIDAPTFNSAVLPLATIARVQMAIAPSMKNLKQIALAMHSFHDDHKTLPAQATSSKDKKPLLSWRVQILPYINELPLYKQFHHDEPWDSTHNKTLIPKMPDMYRSPLSNFSRFEGRTTYLVPTGPKLVFDGFQKMRLRQITDGTTNTFLVLDADDSKAVIWTKPEDFPVEEKKPPAGHFRPSVNRILVALCDGDVQMLSARTSKANLWRYFCPTDGQPIALTEEK